MRLPTDRQRITIVGRTGSGKTQAAAWHLSLRRFDQMPWIVYDYKIDPLLNEIAGVEHIDTETIPSKPGIYLVHPHPDDLIQVASQMTHIWERENIGVYVDEGYMVCPPGKPNSAFRLILTQGRTKHIPMIVLSQRPVWLDRFVFSECEFFQIFALTDSRDRGTIGSYVPANLDERLPDYHSYYYDVAKDEMVVLKPVPEKSTILDSFARRFENMREKQLPRRVVFI